MSVKLREDYDVVVLGDHPAALLAAAGLAQKGASTLVLPFYPSCLTQLSPKGQCLDPETNFLFGLSNLEGIHGLLFEALGDLGVSLSGLKVVRALEEEVLPQVLTPAVRVHFKRQEAVLKSELEREVGELRLQELRWLQASEEVKPWIQSWWKHALDHYGRAKVQKKSWDPTHAFDREFKKAFPRLSAQYDSTQTRPEFVELFEGFWYGALGYEWQEPRFGRLLKAHALAQSAGMFRGGLSAYRSFLCSVARRHGAQISDEMRCRRLFIEDGVLRGVQLSQAGKMISVRAGILGGSLAQARDLIYLSGERNRRTGLKLAPAPEGWRFSIALTVHREAIPPGMTHRSIWKEPGAPALEIEFAATDDYGLSKSDNVLVFLRTTLPYRAESLDPDYQLMMGSRMLAQLGELVPFLEYHVVNLYPDCRLPPTLAREQFAEAYGFLELEKIPDNLRVIPQHIKGVGHESGIAGLYVASNESYPDLGSLGPTLAALQAQRALTQLSPV
jgi:hypothetical protein